MQPWTFALTAAALASALVITPASAAPTVIASDNFDAYAAGALNGGNGGTGFAGAWTAVASTHVVAAAPADSPMSGNAVVFSNPNSDSAAQRKLGTTLAGDVLVSFQFQFDGGAIGDNDFLGLWFGTSTGPNIGLKSNCGTGGACTADIFARTNGGSGQFSYNIQVGETVEVLGYLQKVGGSSVYNRFSLWVNDGDVADFASVGAPDAVFNGPSSVASFSTIGFRTANLDGSPQDRLLIDNLQIAVVPTPGSVALAGLALLLCGATTRRRRA